VGACGNSDATTRFIRHHGQQAEEVTVTLEKPYPPFPKGMILLVEVGSTAHGTGLPGGEDHDETAVVVESPGQVLGLGPALANHMERTQPEGHRSGPGDTDRQVYSLRNFVAMAAGGNPSILLTLWAPVIQSSEIGRDLIGLRDAFVGRHVLPRYRGYMQSQVMRMQGLKGSGHGRRGGGKRDELVAAHGYDCYLDDTEFLTRAGWRPYAAIEDGEEVGTISPTTGLFEFQVPTDRVSKTYTGPIHVFKTRYTECAVTPNHRMLVSKVERGASNSLGSSYRSEVAQWGFRPASELTDRAWHFRVAAAPSTTEFDVTDAYLSLVGAYVSEGCVQKRLKSGQVSVLGFTQKVGGRLEVILAKIATEFPCRSYCYRRFFADRDLPCETTITTLADRHIASRIVEECGEHSRHKHLPPWAFDLSERQANLLLEAMLAGDGTKYRTGGHIYYTNSSRLAGEVQALAVIAGRRSNIWGPYSGMFQVFIHDSGLPVATSLYPRQSLTIIDVEDRTIVCFTVPNEILLTRRNGRIAIQGNTKFAMHAARLGYQGRELVTTGGLSLPVSGEPGEWLRAVRRGDVPYDEWLARVGELDAELAALTDDDRYRPGPDRMRIERFAVEAHRRAWGW
jgi:hypothetical protein